MTAQAISADFFAGYLGEKDSQLEDLQRQIEELQRKVTRCKQERETSQDTFESVMRYCLTRFASASPDVMASIAQTLGASERRPQRNERFDEWANNILDAPEQQEEEPTTIKFPTEETESEVENDKAEVDSSQAVTLRFEQTTNWEDVEWEDEDDEDDVEEDDDTYYVEDDSIEWVPVDDDLAAEMEREAEEKERRRQELLANPPVEEVPEKERIKPRGTCYVKPRPNDDFDCENRAVLTAVICKKLRFPTSEDAEVDKELQRKITFFGDPVNSVDLRPKAREAFKYMIDSRSLSVPVSELAANLGWSDEDAVEACRDLQTELGFSFPGLAGEFVSPHVDGEGWVPWDDLEFKLYRYGAFEEPYETKFLVGYQKVLNYLANRQE